jgi:hypothetical protein
MVSVLGSCCVPEGEIGDAGDTQPEPTETADAAPAKVGSEDFTDEDDLKVYVPSVRLYTPGESTSHPAAGRWRSR